MKAAEFPRLKRGAAAVRSLAALAVASAALVLGAGQAQAAATIVIVNQNAPGAGFNDPTPTAPVGGNPGTTLGQQRLNAFQYAANIWGATLTSSVTIRIGASFVPLSCTATSAVLGAAGADEIWSNFPNAPRANTWYPSALASKLEIGRALRGAEERCTNAFPTQRPCTVPKEIPTLFCWRSSVSSQPWGTAWPSKQSPANLRFLPRTGA